MTADQPRPIEDRIIQLLDHFDIPRAHIAASVPADWVKLAVKYADRLASLSLICPTGFNSDAISSMASRVMVCNGDQGPIAARTRAAVAQQPDATLVTFDNYEGLLWSDVAAERHDDLSAALIAFIERMEQQSLSMARPLVSGHGEVAGLTYHIEGTGPPLVILPMSFAPSQWEPIRPLLSEHFCTITLRGPFIGMAAMLEDRGQSPGFVRTVRTLVHEVALRPGETILDVGCGTGVMARWLAEYTHRAHHITAVDINRYLLQEAKALVDKAALQDLITFQEGNAETLPFADNHFDVTLSLTVMEEGNADRMLSELVRVTKPGGRVAAMVRGEDCPAVITLPLPEALHTKVARTEFAGVSVEGCADVSLYRRFVSAGLTQVRKFPQLAVYDDPQSVRGQQYQNRILSRLTPDEAKVWYVAVAQAEAEGTFILGIPLHCAIGTKS